MKLRYALPSRCFSGQLKSALRAVAALRVEGVQLDVRNELPPAELGTTGLRQFRKMLDELGLRVASCALPTRKPLADPESLERRVEAIRSALLFAFQLGADVLTVRAGKLPNPETEPLTWSVLIEVLNDLARYGNHVGSTLCLTLSADEPDRFRQLLSSVTEGPLGINFDPVACLAGERSPGEVFREFYGDIRHVRARDATRDLDGDLEETVLGRGAVDWAELLALLYEAEYSGWILLDRTSGEDRAGDLQRGLRYLQKLLPF